MYIPEHEIIDICIAWAYEFIASYEYIFKLKLINIYIYMFKSMSGVKSL